jgi:hypothetical protein
MIEKRSVFVLLSSAMIAAAAPPAPTFNRDILPILQKQCQSCHRPGEVAPMSLLTYKDARPWAKAMKEAVLTKKMPPWFADLSVGHFRNSRSLSEAQIQTLVAWADGGAPEGNAKDAPPPVQFSDGWTIGKPDIIVQFPHEIQIAATGTLDQSNLLVKVNFPKDLWVKAAEVRPGNRRVVHHMKAWVRPPGSAWLKDAPEGEMYNPRRGTVADFAGGRGSPGATQGRGWAGNANPGLVQDMLAKYNPGVEGQSFTVGDAAKFIPAGSDIVFEVHYNSTGKPETDRSSVGIVLADTPPQYRHVTTTGVNNTRFAIPPRDPHFEVKAEALVEREVKLVWLQPHMHYRAKEYELRAIYPSGESQLLLKVPDYSFAWQIGYEFAEPVLLPKGTRLESKTWYDNSVNNKFNPDPQIEVRYGPQSWDEMAVTFLGYIVDAKADIGRVFLGPGRGAMPPIE